MDLEEEYGVTYGPSTYQIQNDQDQVLVFSVRGTNAIWDLYQVSVSIVHLVSMPLQGQDQELA